MEDKMKILRYSLGLLCYGTIIVIRLLELLNEQTNSNWSALIAWLTVLLYFLLYNNYYYEEK